VDWVVSMAEYWDVSSADLSVDSMAVERVAEKVLD
jgi:hypothetical protein